MSGVGALLESSGKPELRALFTRAGLPASRCNLARVVVNGVDLGTYSNENTIALSRAYRLGGVPDAAGGRLTNAKAQGRRVMIRWPMRCVLASTLRLSE